MKILLIVLCFVWSSSLAQAQNKTINDFYKTHRKGAESIGLLVPGWVVQAGINIAVGKESRRQLKPFRPFLRRLSSLRLLAVGEASQLPEGAVRNFVREVQQEDFSTLMRIKEETTHIDILVRIKERGPKKKRRSIVKNVLMVVEDEGEVAVFTINGRWQMEQLNKLLKEQKVHQLWASN